MRPSANPRARRTARLLRSAARAVRGHPLRTALMMLGPLVGVCALTVVVAIGERTKQDVVERVNRMLGASTLFLRAGASRTVGAVVTRPGSGPAPGAAPGVPPAAVTRTLTLDDVAAIEREIAEVEVVDPLFMMGKRPVEHGARSAQTMVIGQSQHAERAWNRPVTRGAHISAEDVASAARVAMIGEVVARTLFEGRDPVGEQIRIGDVPFRVIGVLDRVGADPHGLDKDDEIVVPVTTLMRRLVNADFIGGAKIVLREGSDAEEVSFAVQDLLRSRHRIDADEPDDFAIFTPLQAQERVEAATRTFTLFMPLAASVALLVGALVVAALMLAAVNERRAEIGLRRALGARPADIRLQFLAESVTVTLLGGVLALLLAWPIVRAHQPEAGVPWAAGLLGLGVSILVGALAGVLPALRAARLDPVQALR